MATLGEYLGAGSGTTKLLLHLNGNSTDSSGNGNNGTDTNVTYGLGYGKFGQGAGFNGNSSLISIADSTSLSPNGSYTISFWANIQVYKGNYTLWVGKWGESNNQREYAIGESTTSSNKIAFFHATTGSYGTNSFSVEVSRPSTNSWHNIICVFVSGTGGYIYIDGNQVGFTTSSATSVTNGTEPNTIGSAAHQFGGVTNYFDGYIDEVIMETRAWSASEIKKYYTYAKGRFGII